MLITGVLRPVKAGIEAGGISREQFDVLSAQFDALSAEMREMIRSGGGYPELDLLQQYTSLATSDVLM